MQRTLVYQVLAQLPQELRILFRGRPAEHLMDRRRALADVHFPEGTSLDALNAFRSRRTAG